MKNLINNFISKITLNSKDVKPYVFIPKPEQHPQSVNIASTTTPDGKSMENWIEGGWAKHLHQ